MDDLLKPGLALLEDAEVQRAQHVLPLVVAARYPVPLRAPVAPQVEHQNVETSLHQHRGQLDRIVPTTDAANSVTVVDRAPAIRHNRAALPIGTRARRPALVSSDFDKRLAGDGVRVDNVTARHGVLVVVGPRAREVLTLLTDADLSNAAFPWLSTREITVGLAPVRALRVNFVGELGWELHHPIEYQNHLCIN